MVEPFGGIIPQNGRKACPLINHRFLLFYSAHNLLKRALVSSGFSEDVFIDCHGVSLGLEWFMDKSRLLDWGGEVQLHSKETVKKKLDTPDKG